MPMKCPALPTLSRSALTPPDSTRNLSPERIQRMDLIHPYFITQLNIGQKHDS